MRYLFGGVVQTKTNSILWNLYIVGLLELIITFPATRHLRMKEKQLTGTLFDTYKATLIYNICNTPPCLDYIIQRKESKYDLRHQHRVRVQRFETYYMKNSISYIGSVVLNLLEPALSAPGIMPKGQKSLALRNLNLN